jgi:hypothetical protein
MSTPYREREETGEKIRKTNRKDRVVSDKSEILNGNTIENKSVLTSGGQASSNPEQLFDRDDKRKNSEQTRKILSGTSLYTENLPACERLITIGTPKATEYIGR